MDLDLTKDSYCIVFNRRKDYWKVAKELDKLGIAWSSCNSLLDKELYEEYFENIYEDVSYRKGNNEDFMFKLEVDYGGSVTYGYDYLENIEKEQEIVITPEQLIEIVGEVGFNFG
ncbi:MAG: hypothetical protein RR744_00355 [Cellulosilyticaceae bacterium]